MAENGRKERTYDLRKTKDLEDLDKLPYAWEVIDRFVPCHGDGIKEIIQGHFATKRLAKAYAIGFVDMARELLPEKIIESWQEIVTALTEPKDWELRFSITWNDGSHSYFDVIRKRDMSTYNEKLDIKHTNSETRSASGV